MSQTLNAYKDSQSRTLQLLAKLESFVVQGDEFGLSSSSGFREKISKAIESTAHEKLKIALIGGFSEGKTSIAAAWLGKIDKSSMNISASESSNEVQIYHIDDDYILIDTPGLYGYKEQENLETHEIEKYKDITKKYVSEAHIILYVMNPKNPIKESHKDDVIWLFKTLNLLPRTVFVLGRFDEVADVEDSDNYQKNLVIKQKNVVERLTDFLVLNADQQKNIRVVGVSANPFEEGTEYWLKNQEEFKKLSHIETLQSATKLVVQSNGSVSDIINETKKSIISDILYKQMPIVNQRYLEVDQQLNNLSKASDNINMELSRLNQKIVNVQGNLNSFFIRYFSDLVLQVKGTSMETIGDFLVREIGDEGCIISTKVQEAFSRETNDVTISLNKNIINFEADLNTIESAYASLSKQGLTHVVKNVRLDNTKILAARDLIKAGGNMLGLGKSFSSALKFKPYGAIKMANKLNGAVAVFGIAFEAWDSWQQAKREEEFEKAKQKMQSDLQQQQAEILKLIMSKDDFIEQFFPLLPQLKSQVNAVEDLKTQHVEQKARFEIWKKEGDAIDAEFKVIV